MPSSPSDSGKTVSDASSATGDSTPAETDLGMQRAQEAGGDRTTSDAPLSPAAEGTDEEPRRGEAPEPSSTGGSDEAGPTAGPPDRQV